MGNFKLSTEDYNKLSLLSELASYQIEDLFDNLGIDCKKNGKRYIGCCPIHNGDKYNAWNFYPDGYAIRGIWVCRTKHCQKIFKNTIPGLVRGILSRDKLNWSIDKPEKMIGFGSVIEYLCKFVGQEWKSLKVDLVKQDKFKFINNITNLGLLSREKENGWDIDKFVPKLEIPSPYFLKRGLSEKILKQYHIGDCLSQDVKNPMYNRAVIPVMNSPKTMIGATGRSKFDQCKKCETWHGGTCPLLKFSAEFAKWRHNNSFPAEEYLFNYFEAKPFIEKSKTLIIVEGPVDCLRLIQCGIKNVVALFGVNLSDQQSILIESSGAHNIVLMLDKDKAGELGIQEIKKMLYKSFRVFIPDLPKKDPGELTDKEIEELKLWNY